MTESPSKHARPPAKRNSIALAEVGTSILHRSNTSFVCWPCSNAETMHFGLILLKNSVSQRGRSIQQNILLPNSLFANVVFRTGTHENSVPGFSDDFRLLELFKTIRTKRTFDMRAINIAGCCGTTFCHSRTRFLQMRASPALLHRAKRSSRSGARNFGEKERNT